MFLKISSDDDFNRIRQGDWIVQYPLTGKREEEIDLSDERFFMLYEVNKIDRSSGIIVLKNLDGPPGNTNKLTDIQSAPYEGLLLLEKHKNDLIAGGLWWHRP